MSASEKTPNGHAAPSPGKVVRVNRADAASIALKVALNDRSGKPSQQWMIEIAEQMGVTGPHLTGA